MEKDPWWKHVEGPFLTWQGPKGIKKDGGGCTRGQGRVSDMRLWRAVCNRNAEEVVRLVDSGVDVNEVEAAGNTPLHAAAYEGWAEGVQLLLSLGAAVNASNNAGDRAWHWATNMGNDEVVDLLEKHGASKERGEVLVPDHVNKVRDFFAKPCWAHHPPPHADFLAFKRAEHEALLAERKKIIPGMP